MKALVLSAVGQLDLAEVPCPVPAADELLIRTGATTICTSDLNDIRENVFAIPLPVIPGHEAAGVVAAVGREVNDFAVGDRVATHPVHPCGKCPSCLNGLGHLCDAMEHFGMNRPGTFAEFFGVRRDRVRKIPVAMDFATAALAEPVAVCLEALERTQCGAGDSLLILGDGPFGVLMNALAEARGLRVVLAGRDAARLTFSRARLTLNTSGMSDEATALKKRGGEEFRAAILAVESAEALAVGLDCLRPRGRLVVFAPMAGLTPVNIFRLVLKELEMVGACNDGDLFDEALAALADPGLDLGRLVTHRFALEDFRKALDQAATHPNGTMKVAFQFTH